VPEVEVEVDWGCSAAVARRQKCASLQGVGKTVRTVTVDVNVDVDVDWMWN
jgi:hypothetical protein